MDSSTGEVSLSRTVSLTTDDLDGEQIFEAEFTATEQSQDCQEDPLSDPNCYAVTAISFRVADVNNHAPIIVATNEGPITIPENSPELLEFGITVSDADTDSAFSTWSLDYM